MRTVSEINKLARVLGGVPVLGCIPGSPSANAGVRYGDILLEANGQRTTDLHSYVKARDLREDAIRLVVFRDGASKTLELDRQSYRASHSEIRTFFNENASLFALNADSESGEGEEVC